MDTKKVRWRPLESNPQTMTSYIKKLGVTGDWEFCDVWSIEPETLSWIPQPCCAFILLFPITDIYKAQFVQEKEQIEKDGQKVSNKLFYMKQTIGNACGTIGVLHAIGNNADDKITIKQGSPMNNFLEKVKGFNPAEIGAALETDDSFTDAHTACAQEGDTAPLSAEAPLDLHFVALVHKDGSLYELDGRKSFPINHGPSSEETFVSDASAVCKKFMNRDAAEKRFTILALSKSP